MKYIQDTLFRQNPHWQKEYKKRNYIERELLKEINFNSKQVEIITGIRRSGKSTIFNILIDTLVFEKKVNSREILFLNLDSPVFVSLYEDPQALYEVINQAEIASGKKIKYLFLDEIQNIEMWEKWIKEVYDLKIFKKIFITGSNSKLLESQYISRLSGRYFSHVNYPFSFREYLKVKKQSFYENKVDNFALRNQLTKHFKNYLRTGGFPQVILEKDVSLLESYYKTIILKDVIDNNQIREKNTLKELAYYFITNYTSLFSYSKLGKLLNNNENTIKEYVDCLKSAYIFDELKKFDFSVKKQNFNKKKIYCLDNGLITQIGFNFSEDEGKLLENSVFIELKRQDKEVFYYDDNNECDFVIKKGKKIVECFQVSYEITEKNREREIKGLVEALEKFNLIYGVILTYNQEDVLEVDGKKIEIKPVWSWILENKNE